MAGGNLAESLSAKYGKGSSGRSPSVKRILQEVREIQRQEDEQMRALHSAGPSSPTSSSSAAASRYPDVCIMAEALEENIFEWHFAISGQRGSDYEGGIYHGRILLPPEYPFKPPDFVMLTPSGRFQVRQRSRPRASSPAAREEREN